MTDELRASWCPIALSQVCKLATSGSRGWAEFYTTSGAGFIRAQNIRFGKLRLTAAASRRLFDALLAETLAPAEDRDLEAVK